MRQSNMNKLSKFLAVTAVLLACSQAQAEDLRKQSKAAKAPGLLDAPAAGATAGTGPSASGGERVNVESIKEKYWARGDESEIGVVQNRLYSKERKFQLGIFGGLVTTDPFLSVKNYGTTFGYNFSEYIGIHGVYFKDSVGNSSARDLFIEKTGATTNSNPPNNYLGAELTASILYGKLSLVGKSIIYFDMHLLLGVGRTSIDLGTPASPSPSNTTAGARTDHYFTPSIGLGQQIYLSKLASIRLDYRLMRYSEHIVEKVVPATYGFDYGTRTNYSNVVTLGVNFLIGGGR